MLEILKQRRTIRKYSEQNIDQSMLDTLFEAAAQASNTGNMQTYSVVVTRNADIKKQLAPAHFNQAMVEQAPVVLTFCADFRRFSLWCEQRDAKPGYGNFESFISAAVDAIIFAQTLAIAAEAKGLGLCYLGTTTYNAQEIIAALELPQLVMPITTITLGYPAHEPPITDRLPLSAIVHNETYHDFSSADIDAIYATKENSDFYKQFVAENNKATLAQVFTDIRYTQKNNEFFSEKFTNALKQQGFLQ